MRRTRKPLAALAAVAAGSALLAAPSSAAEPVTLDFAYTGAAQTVVVPDGARHATFVLRGGTGGGSYPLLALGGFGAELRATLPVTPGQTFELYVGGRGTTNRFNGAFNGGGMNGGLFVGGDTNAGGGGGATDVRPAGGGLESRLLVAAGGGGAGVNENGVAGTAGAGGNADEDGHAGLDTQLTTGGGGGLTSGAGGAAGTGPLPGSPGRAGRLGVGADGLEQQPSYRGASGGGGGGWIGGGSGGIGGVAVGPLYGGGGGGAGGQSYSAPTAENVTRTLARVNGDGSATVTFSAGEPTATVPPTVSGTAQVGRTLTCTPGTWTAADRLAIAWLRDGEPIAGATAAEHEVVAADGGHRLACRVTATNANGSAVATSSAIEVLPYVPLSNLTPPRITGARTVGATLTCDPGRWTNEAAFAYRWLRDGEPVVGATGATRISTRTDAGTALQCEVTATAGSSGVVANTVAVGGPPRLLLPASSALVSRAGVTSVVVACLGSTDCRIPAVTVTSGGSTIARADARTVRAGTTAKVSLRLSRATRRRLAARGSAVTARVVGTPTGGYGGNARVRFVAPRGVR